MKFRRQDKPKKSRQNQELTREGFLTVVVLVAVTGSLALAVLDEGSRPAFVDLAKVVVAGYLAWMTPR